MGTNKTIDDLSEEMLLEIFSYLPLNDIIFSIQFVNYKWKRISYDNELWKHIIYNPASVSSDSTVIRTMQLAPKLNNLILNKRPYSCLVLETIIKCCPNIRRIDFYHYQVLVVDFLRKMAINCPNIEYLQIPYKTLDTFEQAEAIASLQKLRVLKVSGWTDADHPAVLKALADGCPLLECIDLVDTHCKMDDLEYFLHKKKHTLQTIHVKWSYDEKRCVLRLLPTCTALQTVCINSYYNIDVEKGFQAFKTLRGVTSLSLLDFDNADIKRVISIFEYKTMVQLTELIIKHYENYENILARVIVTNCPNLRKIYINECNSLSDESIQDYDKLHDLQYVELKSSAITDIAVACLSRCKKLKHLSLKNCFLLSEEGMKNMTDFHNLQVLKLDSCDVQGLQWNLITSHLKKLTYLSINFCLNVDVSWVQCVQKEKPGLNISYIPSTSHK